MMKTKREGVRDEWRKGEEVVKGDESEFEFLSYYRAISVLILSALKESLPIPTIISFI